MGVVSKGRAVTDALRVGLAIMVAWGVGTEAAAQETAIDRASLMEDVGVLAHDSMAGRRVGTDGNAKARRYIRLRLEEIGVVADSQAFSASGRTSGVNLMGRIPGTGSHGRAIVLSAHYDHLGVRDGSIYNGADDNASGVAGLLAIAENLVHASLEHDVVFVFFDAEESGLLGARAWVDALADPPASVSLNLNLDMVSRSERLLWVVGTHQNPALLPLVQAVEPAAGVKLQFGHDSPEWTGSDNWVQSSDHGPFHNAGVPFLYFGVDDHPDYHRPTDFADRIDAAWYAAAIETIWRVLVAADGW